jgi:hypothetical protein
MAIENPLWPRLLTLGSCLFFGILIGAMAWAIALQLHIGFFVAPLWFSALITIYAASNIFGNSLLVQLAGIFRLPISLPEPAKRDKRLAMTVWSLFLIGTLLGYLVTNLVLKGAS